MTDSVVVEGQVKLRDGKKWKSRWLALRKPSPVADCLLLLVYKDKSDKTKGHKERSSVTLEDICGLDPGLSYEGMSHTMAIICLTQAVMLGFENKETMYAWDVRIRYSLGEVHRFHVVVLPGTKLESGPATLHLCNDHLILVRDVPPTIIGQWKLSDLRRYGAVPNGFVFEGGTRCGYWAGVFFLACAEGEQLSFLFDCIVRGISPTRGPFGLRPVLPDPNANPANMEDRVTHETLELEKRLSLLSHSSRQSSTASTSSYGASVALGDDRSLSSSSSDTSHSDTSIGSRLAMWPEPSLGSASMESHELAAVKSMHPGEEKMYAEVMRGSRPPPKPPRPRKPHEIVRQSSSDSGIATGSHSSYSGSFSSYAGSLDICHADEFGSLLSLPLNFASDQNLCTCQHGEHPRAVGSEYQVPSSLKHLYDTPRSLLQAATAREVQCKSSVSTLLKDQGTSTLLQSATDTNVAVPAQRPDRGLAAALSDYGSTRDSDETYVDYVPRWSVAKQQGEMLECKSSEVAPSADVSTDPCEIYSPQPGVTRALFTVCPVCGGLKGTTLSHSGVLTIPAVPGSKCDTSDKNCGMSLYHSLECASAEENENSSDDNRESTEGPERTREEGIYEAIWEAKSSRKIDPEHDRTMEQNTAYKDHDKHYVDAGSTPDKFKNILNKNQQRDGKHFSISSGMCSNYCTLVNSNPKTCGQHLYEPMASTLRYLPLSKTDVTKTLTSSKKEQLPDMHNDIENQDYSSTKEASKVDFDAPEVNSSTATPRQNAARLQKPLHILKTVDPTESLSGEKEKDLKDPNAVPVTKVLMNSSGTHPYSQPPESDDPKQEVSNDTETEEDKKPKRKDEKRKTDLTEGRGTEKSTESDEKSELMASCGQRKIFHETEGATISVGSSGTLRTHREHSSLADPRGTYELMASAVESPKRCDFGLLGEYGGMFAYPVDLPVPDRPRGDGVTYVNIPVSPTSKKQLHYMELERQEPGSGARGNTIHLHKHRGGSTKYAQIDITATETAHKVGTQHAQFREERLQELEQKKRGAQQ
ncbi:uncharacterized protein LOC117408662 isoform X2 [Acipenser ruthenus]|uniref:uncharacterized protein LOC117408662 isoform X2 n=1 Tax=Acipenser ruthenus TaxID=7906 RepID=UPI0027412EFA|nr:uncharacterized protein LOC117408662 isoform X2 [Acipenser ruthenus]